MAIDQREKAPYHFEGLAADSKLGYRPLVVQRDTLYLKSGDYSIVGCQEYVAIERKSIFDLYSTLGQHHDRFEHEVERLSRMDFAAIVVEASWEQILTNPPERSRVLPKSIVRTCVAWTIRYRVPWFTVEGRRAGEILTFRLLEKWFLEAQERVSEPDSHCKICGRSLKTHRSWARGMGPVCNARGNRLLAAAITGGGV